ncbi:glycosyltransferase family 4 protein [Fimbriiglobus ruber]|uniref:Glycosyltransferase n=1 Tax=Fimbriiglobus ruber TaxID=1908690 RepID=A0A225DW69_9BACT|nr:glycosyltransferase family 1 protein [Fimbriiglobus ruber]OWK40447.1 Glycosyltransferase [Fimbriiglobus ruber]
MTVRPFTVAVDGRVVHDEVRRGIAKTTIAVYRALAVARPMWQFRVFHRSPATDDPFVGFPNVQSIRINIRGDRFDLWSKLRLPLATGASRADVFHAPAGLAPRFPLAPLVTTIHDLIPLDTRPNDPDVQVWAGNVRRAARRARRILTVSQHARSRIVDLLGVDPAKISVVQWGTNFISEQSDSIDGNPIRERYGIPPAVDYVLHFGMADPRKNTARVLDAWAALPAAVREAALLVVVGLQGAARDQFTEAARRLGIVDRVRLHGYAPEEDVRGLLAGATVLCYPTLYEGFGLPVLDGFAAGVPVLTGNLTSLPEVAGDAALVVDPTDTAAITAGLARLLTDADLRAVLVERGRRRVRAFTWAAAADEIAAVFEAAAGRRTS